jgi:hypothetical protein
MMWGAMINPMPHKRGPSTRHQYKRQNETNPNIKSGGFLNDLKLTSQAGVLLPTFLRTNQSRNETSMIVVRDTHHGHGSSRRAVKVATDSSSGHTKRDSRPPTTAKRSRSTQTQMVLSRQFISVNGIHFLLVKIHLNLLPYTLPDIRRI